MESRISEQVNVVKEGSPESRAAFEKIARVKQFGKGEHIFIDREPVSCFYFLITGYISLYKISNSMENKVIFICSSGEMINEVMIQDVYASINAQTLSNCVVALVDKEEMRRLMAKDFLLSEAVMKSMAVKIRRLYRQLKNTPNAVHLDKQIAAKIWKLSRDYGIRREDGIEIDFDISVSFLAEMVGAKRETVSRQLKKLIEQELVTVSKKRFVIPDRDMLSDYIKGV